MNNEYSSALIMSNHPDELEAFLKKVSTHPNDYTDEGVNIEKVSKDGKYTFSIFVLDPDKKEGDKSRLGYKEFWRISHPYHLQAKSRATLNISNPSEYKEAIILLGIIIPEEEKKILKIKLIKSNENRKIHLSDIDLFDWECMLGTKQE